MCSGWARRCDCCRHSSRTGSARRFAAGRRWSAYSRLECGSLVCQRGCRHRTLAVSRASDSCNPYLSQVIRVWCSTLAPAFAAPLCSCQHSVLLLPKGRSIHFVSPAVRNIAPATSFKYSSVGCPLGQPRHELRNAIESNRRGRLRRVSFADHHGIP